MVHFTELPTAGHAGRLPTRCRVLVALNGVLVGVLLVADAWAVSFLSFDPRSVSMAGSGVATARAHNAGLFNPALLVGRNAPAGRQIHAHGYAGARLLDRDDFLGNAEHFSDKYDGASLKSVVESLVDLEAIEAADSADLRRATAEVGEILADINRLSDRPLRAGASAGFSVSRRTPEVAFGGHYRRFMVLGSVSRIAESDNANVERAAETVNLLADLADQRTEFEAFAQDRDAITVTDLLDQGQALLRTLVRLNEHVQLSTLLEDFSEGALRHNDLEDYLREPLPERFDSRVETAGAEVMELAFSVAGRPRERWRIGAAVKLVEFTTIGFSQEVTEFDIEAYRDRENRRRHLRLNLDAGVLYDLDEAWQIGLAVRNLVPYDYSGIDGTRIAMRPIVRAGLGYTAGRLRFSTDLDLTRNEPLGFDSDKQFLSVGLEWFAWRNTALRVGSRSNLVDGEWLPSAGLGIGGARMHLDLAVARSSRQDEWALAVGAGFSL